MSKLTNALVIIKNECEGHIMCDTCPLRYKEEYGGYTCRLDEWGATRAIQPRNWPIEEVRAVEHEK